MVLVLVAGLTVWLTWPTPPRDRSAFEQALASLADARGVRYTDTSIIGENRDITTTEFGAQFGVTGYPGLENLDQGVLRVGDRVYTRFKNDTESRLGKWTADDETSHEELYTGLIDLFPSPGHLADQLTTALAALPDLPAPTDPDLPTLTVAGVPALRADTSAGTLYVAKNAPYRVLRLEPQGLLSPSRLTELRSLTAVPSLPALPSPRGVSGTAIPESQGMDLSLINDGPADQMYDTLAEHTKQLVEAVDGGIHFSLTASPEFDCNAAGCTVQASFTGTVAAKARTHLAGGGQVTAKLTVTNVTIAGRLAGGCVGPPTTIPITGNTASGQLSCVDTEAGPVFAAVDTENKAKAQQQADAAGGTATLRFSSRGQAEIDAVATAPAEVDRLLKKQKDQRLIGGLKVGGNSGPWVPDKVTPAGAVPQSLRGSCLSACGEMLTRGAALEKDLIAEIGEWSNPKRLADALNRRAGSNTWTGGYFAGEAEALTAAERGPMAATLMVPGRRGQGHAVVTQPLGSGRFLVRDPSPGVTYEVSSDWIKQYVQGGVFQ